MKGRSKRVLWIVFAIILFGTLTTRISSWHSRPQETPSPSQGGVLPFDHPQLVKNYGRLPLAFEINQGQTDPQVRFLSRGSGYTMFLTGTDAVLSLRSASQGLRLEGRRAEFVAPRSLSDAPALPRQLLINPFQGPQDQRTPRAIPVQSQASAVVRLGLVGTNPKARVTGLDPLPGKSNYFIGNDPKKWRTNVPTYAKVRYQNVYPGVDLVYYGNQGGHLEYDFVVAPGADPRAITLDVGIHSHAPLQIADNGDLVISTDGGELRFQKPLVYQPDAGSSLDTRHSSPVEGRFLLDAQNRLHFALGPYDHTQPLVLDPVLSYSTYLGGSGSEAGYGIAVDTSGNVYVTGLTVSTDFPVLSPLQASNESSGNGNAFVAKLNKSGSALVYSTYLGGNGPRDNGPGAGGMGIAVDAKGNAYVTGTTTSTDFPTVNALQATNKAAPNYTAFVAELNPTGSALLYSTYLGGHAGGFGEQGNAIAVDSSGNAYVTGKTSSYDFPTVNPLQPTNNAHLYTGFVAKLNPTGSALVYSTYLGGSAPGYGDQGYAIAVDSFGDAYVTGVAWSTDFPILYPLQATNKSGYGTGFVAELNPLGDALIYSTYLGGSGASAGTSGSGDAGLGIAVDAAGNTYITGITSSKDFPIMSALQAINQSTSGFPSAASKRVPTPTMPCTAFVTKLYPAGVAFLYSTYLGGSGASAGYGIAADAAGNAYVTGTTTSADFPAVNAVQLNGGWDAFVAKLNPTGAALMYSTQLGGGGVNLGMGIAVDTAGSAYVTGSTNGNFPTVGPLQAADDATDASTTYCSTHALCDTTGFVAKLALAPAAVGLSTTTLNFGGVLVNAASPAQHVTLTDTGDSSLNIKTIIASGNFALVTTPSSCLYSAATVAPTASCTIDLIFLPKSAGSLTGTVTITSNASGSPQTVQLSGSGLVAAATVSPTSLSFNNQPVGTTSNPQAVSVTNTASQALGITSLTISNGWAQSNNCLPSVGPSATCSISVTFTPTNSGSQTGALTLTDYASNSPQTVSLSGTGTAALAVVSTTTLTFAAQSLGSASAPQAVTLSNKGNLALTISSIAVSGDFSQTNTCGTSVGTNSSCTINVTFTPTATGARTGTLTITDNSNNNSAGSTQTVNLSGTGLGPIASPSSSSLSFANQLTGTASSAQQVTLQNTGTEVLSITSISLTGANSSDFSLSQNCGSSLAANASCQISVTFTPTARGTRTAAVSLADNAPGSPQTIALSGTGIAPVANLSPSSLTFSGQFVGTTGSPQNVTLTNNGDVALNISSVQTSAQFAMNNGCASTLAVSASCTIGVSFSPSAAGSQTGTLTISDNAPGSPQTIQLSGTGMDFQMSSLTPSQTVTAGQTATYSLALAPEGGLNQTANLTCSGAPSLATCTVTPSSVPLSGTSSATVTVKVTTTAPSLAPPWERVLPPSVPGLGRVFWLCALLGLVSLVVLAGAGKRRAAAYLLGACLLMAILWSGCGGGGSQIVHTLGTPPGTYTLDVSATVTSTAPSSTLTHDFKFTLTVD